MSRLLSGICWKCVSTLSDTSDNTDYRTYNAGSFSSGFFFA
jgi:hypothetical protein